VIDTGYAYRVKDEAWIWLYGTTTMVVIEEGEQAHPKVNSSRFKLVLALAPIAHSFPTSR
jgi:predicted P-loop ATPase/GTPase